MMGPTSQSTQPRGKSRRWTRWTTKTETTYSVTVSVTDGKDDQGAVEDSPQEDTFINVDIEVADVNEPPEFEVANLESEGESDRRKHRR